MSKITELLPTIKTDEIALRDLSNLMVVVVGDKALTPEDYSAIVTWTHDPNNKDSAAAQFLLGIMSWFGDHGITRDKKLAVEHFEKSAALGCGLAHCALAEALLRIETEHQDIKTIISHLEQAILKDNRKAEYMLGCLFYADHIFCKRELRDEREIRVNIPIPKDFNRAFQLINSAHIKGFPIDHKLLGQMYYCGRGTVKNIEKALYHFDLAAAANDPTALGSLGRIYSTDETVKDLKKAFDYYQRAAQLGDIEALVQMGDAYDNESSWNSVVKEDKEMAFKYYLAAANNGHVAAQNNVGWAYHNGFGVAVNFEQAIAWYQKSAAQNNTIALMNLGNLQSDDKKTPASFINFNSALQSYRRAAELGCKFAQYKLGRLYQYGHLSWGLAANREQSKLHFLKAAEQNHVDAQFELGRMLEAELKKNPENLEVRQSVEQWFLRAHQNGHRIASLKLAQFYFIFEDYKKARELFHHVVEKSNHNLQDAYVRESIVQLAYMKEFGLGEERNLAQAYLDLQTLVNDTEENISAVIFEALARTCEKQGNEKEAFEWYLKAGRQFSATAIEKIIEIYTSKGSPDDLSQAEFWKTRLLPAFMIPRIIEDDCCPSSCIPLREKRSEPAPLLAQFTNASTNAPQVLPPPRVGDQRRSADLR